MNQSVQPPAPPTWLLVLCIGISPLAMTAAIPATTEIMREFSTEYGIAQTMLTTFLVSMGIAQLFIGFLSDRFGRRPVIIAGLGIFAIGCFLSSLAPTMEWLLASRVIQGIGAAAGVSISRAIVRDSYSREKAASMIAYISMSMIVAPMLGTTMGGFLTELASWRFIFVVLGCAASLVMLVVIVRLRETGAASMGLSPRFVASSVKLLRMPAYIGYCASYAFAAGMYYAFQAGAPFLIQETMQRSPSEYGLYMTLPALGYFMGNFVSGRFTVRVGPDKMIALALIPITIGLTCFWLAAGTLHPLALILPMMWLTFSNGLTIPGAMSGALSVRPELAGTAAGLSGFLQALTSAMLTVSVGFSQNGSFWPLISVITACGLLTAIGAWVGSRYRL